LRAQQADHHTLTLGEALAIAKKQNVEVMVARLQTLESKQATRIARSVLLPQANLGLQTFVTRFDLQSISGGDRVTALGPYQVIQGGPGFSQVLFNMGAVRHLQGAQQAETTTQNNEKTTEQTVERAVIAQYLSIDRANAELDRANARDAIAQRLETEAEHLQAAGVGTSIDTLRARYQLEAERQRVIDAQAAHKIAKQRLASVAATILATMVITHGQLSAQTVRVPTATSLAKRPDEALGYSQGLRSRGWKRTGQHEPSEQ
jgi:outer membrane protein TolC